MNAASENDGASARDEKELQRLVIESRNKFRTLVDGIDDSILSVDLDFRITSVNQALAQSLGIHPKDLVGKLCREIETDGSNFCELEDLLPVAGKAVESGNIETDLDEVAKNGAATKYYEIRAMPLKDAAKKVDGVILVRRDITVQIEAEKQIREYSQRLETEVRERTAELVETNIRLKDANTELIELEGLKKDLTNMVIHDLKGPLAEIVANLEMIKVESLSEIQEEVLESAVFGSDEMSRMIANLLEISRMEEQKLQVDNTGFSPGELLEDIVKRYLPLAGLKEIIIETALHDDAPDINTDYHLVERITINLVTNAIEHTQESGLIELLLDVEEKEFIFRVKDNGRGIADDALKKIFEKFSQGAEGAAKTGSGLGLTFCRMAVTAMGGWIEVESVLGEGTTFSFGIPRLDL